MAVAASLPLRRFLRRASTARSLASARVPAIHHYIEAFSNLVRGTDHFWDLESQMTYLVRPLRQASFYPHLLVAFLTLIYAAS